jgi:aminopeptidase-like protein
MGDGNRETLKKIRELIPIEIREVPTGYQAYDWEVPKEWNIRDAYIIDPNGKKIADFKVNNLHVVNYSVPINKTVTLDELQNHLYSIESMPNAIPYVTTYYDSRWGFCIPQKERDQLIEGDYKVFIDSSLEDGSLSYGELIIPGKTDKEIFLTSYICHPSMANNECSGPAVLTFIAKWLLDRDNKYTYRIVFAPETIGAIVYINKNYDKLRENVIAGFNLTCIGDDRQYSYMPSRLGNTLVDKVVEYVFENYTESHTKHSFLEKGSDERQYCHPMVDLPLVSIMRSKYGTYPEYHTSLDNLDLVTPTGLAGGFNMVQKSIEILELNCKYENIVICEPKRNKRNLRPENWHRRRSGATNEIEMKTFVKDVMNIIFYCDGQHDLIDLSNRLKISFNKCHEYVVLLKNNGVIRRV